MGLWLRVDLGMDVNKTCVLMEIGLRVQNMLLSVGLDSSLKSIIIFEPAPNLCIRISVGHVSCFRLALHWMRKF